MQINKYIDYTNLKADAKYADIEKLCAVAKDKDYASVCVNSRYVALCKKLLEGSDVKVACVVGFPLGAMSTEAKAFEAKKAVGDGADEIDTVIAVGAVKDGDYDYVEKDVAAVLGCGATVKVILETCLLTDEEIAKASAVCAKAGAHFVKTSTGFSTGGAMLHAVEIMKANCGNCKIKASGGIRDYDTALKYIEAGVSRIGTSSAL